MTNGIIGFNFCLVTLVNEDLPNALVNLKYCGEYSLTIETSPDGITWSTLWTDLLFVRCEEIPYLYFWLIGGIPIIILCKSLACWASINELKFLQYLILLNFNLTQYGFKILLE